MSINAVGPQPQQPGNNIQPRGKYSTVIGAVARRLSLIALPVIALCAIASIPMAQAGFGDCMVRCMAEGGHQLTCAAICAFMR